MVVVDDEPELLGFLQDLLGDEGYQVVAIGHPTLIAGGIAGCEPSLFLIDMMLPSISGIDVAAQLRTGRFGTIPLIAMSASATMIREATESGWFADTVAKPFEVEALLGCLTQHLAARPGQDIEGRGSSAQSVHTDN